MPSRLATTSVFREVTPVTLPPGRLRPATRPSATTSSARGASHLARMPRADSVEAAGEYCKNALADSPRAIRANPAEHCPDTYCQALIWTCRPACTIMSDDQQGRDPSMSVQGRRRPLFKHFGVGAQKKTRVSEKPASSPRVVSTLLLGVAPGVRPEPAQMCARNR
jgi:hypothetical protein